MGWAIVKGIEEWRAAVALCEGHSVPCKSRPAGKPMSISLCMQARRTLTCISMNAERQGFHGQRGKAYANTVFDVVDWISICMHTIAIAASIFGNRVCCKLR